MIEKTLSFTKEIWNFFFLWCTYFIFYPLIPSLPPSPSTKTVPLFSVIPLTWVCFYSGPKLLALLQFPFNTSFWKQSKIFNVGINVHHSIIKLKIIIVQCHSSISPECSAVSRLKRKRCKGGDKEWH